MPEIQTRVTTTTTTRKSVEIDEQALKTILCAHLGFPDDFKTSLSFDCNSYGDCSGVILTNETTEHSDA